MRQFLSFPLRWLDARIDARIARAADAARRAEEVRWWNNQGHKMRSYYVTHCPELLEREEVARWASQRAS